MARAIEAAQAYFRMFADDKDFRRAMTGIRSQLSRMAASVARTGLKMSGLGTAMAAPMLLSARSFAAAGDALQDLSDKTGISASTLSGLAFAGIGTNASLDTLAAGMKRLGRGLHGGQDIGTEFLRIADAIHATEDPVRRIAIATKAFGKSGVELVPFLAQGSAAISRMRKEAEALGVVMTDQQAMLADDLGDSWGKLGAVMGGLKNQIGAAIAPALIRVSELLSVTVGAVSVWVRENPAFVQSAAAFAAAMVAVGAALIGVATAIGVLSSPIGMITAAIAGIGYTVARVSNFSIDAFRGMFDDMKATFGAIVTLIQSGRLEDAGRLAMTGLRVAWGEGMLSIQTKWVEWKTFMAQVIYELAFQVAGYMDAAVKAIYERILLAKSLFYSLYGVLNDAGLVMPVDSGKLRQDANALGGELQALDARFNDKLNKRRSQLGTDTASNFATGEAENEKLRHEIEMLRGELKKAVDSVPKLPQRGISRFDNSTLNSIGAAIFQSSVSSAKGTFEGSRLGQQFLNSGGIDEDQLETQREILREQRESRKLLEKLARSGGLLFGA